MMPDGLPTDVSDAAKLLKNLSSPNIMLTQPRRHISDPVPQMGNGVSKCQLEKYVLQQYFIE